MENFIFELKVSGKGFEQAAQRSARAADVQKAKAAEAMRKQNHALARAHAENSVKETNQQVYYTRLASRMSTVAEKMTMAIRMQSIGEAAKNAATSLKNVLGGRNAEKISAALQTLEGQMEDLDVRMAGVESLADGAMGMLAPSSEVDALLVQVADASGLDASAQFAGVSLPTKNVEHDAECDALSRRLRSLQGLK